MKGKAQSAMEFLMTYGWAILVMIIVIAVLFYIGIMNPDNSQTNSCIFPPGFSCASFKLVGHNDGYGGLLELTVGQALGKTIMVTGVECSQKGEPIWIGSGVYPGVYQITIPTSIPTIPVMIRLESQDVASPEGGLSFATPTPSTTITVPPPSFCDSVPSGYECADWVDIQLPAGESRKLVGSGTDNPLFVCTDTSGVPSDDFNMGEQTKYDQMYKGKIWIQYYEVESGLTRTVVGEISGRFEQ